MVGAKYRHKKRGTTYVVLHEAVSLQCATVPDFEGMFENDYWVVYRDLKFRGRVYVRPYAEFHDGRFELLPEV